MNAENVSQEDNGSEEVGSNGVTGNQGEQAKTKENMTKIEKEINIVINYLDIHGNLERDGKKQSLSDMIDQINKDLKHIRTQIEYIAEFWDDKNFKDKYRPATVKEYNATKKYIKSMPRGVELWQKMKRQKLRADGAQIRIMFQQIPDKIEEIIHIMYNTLSRPVDPSILAFSENELLKHWGIIENDEEWKDNFAMFAKYLIAVIALAHLKVTYKGVSSNLC